MTIYEIICTGIIWIGYGLFACKQSKYYFEKSTNDGMQIFFVAFAPILFIGRAIYGAFKTYE